MKKKFYCESCGTEVSRGEERCPRCGRFFSGVRCVRCGLEGTLKQFRRGCPRCGYKPKQRPSRSEWPVSRYWLLSVVTAVLTVVLLWRLNR